MKALAFLLLLGAAPGERVIDTMDDARVWPAKASDNVTAASVDTGTAVALDYDFGRVSGYAFMRRPVALALPANYELRFRVRGTGGRNDLQLKLTDAKGENVWWKVLTNFRPSAEWREIVIPAGDISFAWGTVADKTLRRAEAVEFVIARNRDGGAGRIEIDDLRFVPMNGVPKPSPAASPNDAIIALARAAPRGAYPRGFTEQPYWTLAGSDGGALAALISEDGAIEPAKGSYSLEPHVIDRGVTYRWADVTATPSLAERDLPIPSVTWTAPGFTLQTTLLADSAGRAVLAGYRLTNTGRERRKLGLTVAVRPYQVNPPAQFLSQRGGVSPINMIRRAGDEVLITQPQEPGDPNVVRRLLITEQPAIFESGSEGRYFSATLNWELDLAAGKSRFISLAIPAGETTPRWDETYRATRAYWRETLDRVAITVPPGKGHIADTVRTSLAHMLMSRDGPMLKPGTRSYNRSWIRDGAMISDALLRLGQTGAARAYADWYAPYLFANGKVPCCVDFRGADPVPENDSHGEFIYLLTQLYRFTGDRAALERDWPKLDAARRYMETLRQSERSPANPRWLYGLMPPSISHEGYSAKAQYSLWDNFWALRGYKDAAFAAHLLAKPEAAAIARQRDEFRADLHTAILAAAAHWKIDHIPGATSLGDFDATSTTIALDPAGEQAALDQRLLTNTFERYWREFVARRDGGKAWTDYTPYELRNVSSFIRLGWRDRVDPLLDFFMGDRRPGAWNGWAEVVGREQRAIRFIGDMPHAWIASDFARAALDMFAYERADEGTIVLGAGFDDDWLAGEGVSIRGLRTTHGTLDLAMRGSAARLRVAIGGSARPPGGFVLPWPFASAPGRVTVNGRRARWQGRDLLIPPTGERIIIIAQAQDNR